MRKVLNASYMFLIGKVYTNNNISNCFPIKYHVFLIKYQLSSTLQFEWQGVALELAWARVSNPFNPTEAKAIYNTIHYTLQSLESLFCIS